MYTNLRRLAAFGLLLVALLIVGSALTARADRPVEAKRPAAVTTCEPLTVAVGKEFELHLAANATTGCSWQVTDLDWKLVELLSIDYDEGMNPDQLLGAEGKAIVRFRALSPGHTSIRLAYGHAWELEKATYQIKTLELTVE